MTHGVGNIKITHSQVRKITDCKLDDKGSIPNGGRGILLFPLARPGRPSPFIQSGDLQTAVATKAIPTDRKV